MRIIVLSAIFILHLGCLPVIAQVSLQQCYNEAEPGNGYDKYLELDPAVEYYGDLSLYNAGDVCIMGNGAKIIVDPGDPNPLLITVTMTHLEIQNCVFIGGIGAIYFAAGTSGEIHNNTMVDQTAASLRTYSIGETNQLHFYNNIIVGSYYGLVFDVNEMPDYIDYNTVYDCDSYRYAEYCDS